MTNFLFAPEERNDNRIEIQKNPPELQGSEMLLALD
jgi:hypothetical protein